MQQGWHPDDQPHSPAITPLGWVRAMLRGVLLAVVLVVGLLLLLLVRLLERPIWGLHRPVSPHITRIVCRLSLIILNIRCRVQGAMMDHPGAVVANHSSWVDIFVLNATRPVYFVSKSEVADWPGIGWLARATGTVFIRRVRSEARAQTKVFQDRLLAGHRLLFFPEGTSTDGSIILPFKTTLFEAFLNQELRDLTWIQPVRIKYTAPDGQEARFYGWWGDMEFGPHALKLLAIQRGGSVDVLFQPPLKVADFGDRKTLARACEDGVRVTGI